MKKLFVITVIAVAIGLSVYKLGLPFLSEKVVEQVIAEYLTDEVIDELLHFANHNEIDLNMNATSLPFQTRDEALKVILNEFSIKEMTTIVNRITDPNITDAALNELMVTMSERFSEEEIAAFKVIGLSEIINKLEED